jgi:probable rRNA maturation factor
MVTVHSLVKKRMPVSLLQKTAEIVLQQEKKGALDLSVVLLGEKNATALNKQYRNKEYAPNVLSFPAKELGLGEIVLCPSVIRKESTKYGIVFKDHLAFMLIHGVLHLLGYDHEKDKQAKVMEQKEQQYLSLVHQ